MGFIQQNELTVPFIGNLAPFDTRFPHLIRWQWRGSQQPERSEIRIRNLETGGDLGEFIQPTMASEFTLHPSIWIESGGSHNNPPGHVWNNHQHRRGNGKWPR